MSWLLRYRFRQYLRSSLFIFPVGCIVLALLLAPVVRWIDQATRWEIFGFTSSGASAVVAALASSLLSLIVFSFSILLLAIQVAGGQLSPRIIARIFRARPLKITLAAFVFSYTYALAALSRIGDRVPQLAVALAIFTSLFSLALFIYLFQTTGEAFRPGTVMTEVARETRSIIEAMYPHPLAARKGEHAAFSIEAEEPGRSVVQKKRAGVLLAFDAEGLLDIAARADCVIEIVPQVGDFVPIDEPIFRLYGAGAASIYSETLLNCIAIGIERTMQQDPLFGLRIIVDIASKALSPAINDPTTGVLAIDQLHHLLHLVSQRQLDTGVVRDRHGDVRLVYRTPDWEDFITLAGTEIRVYGAMNPQVTRRLRAMYDHLLRVVPPSRIEDVQCELARLESTIEGAWPAATDRLIAGASDWQGFGSRVRPRIS